MEKCDLGIPLGAAEIQNGTPNRPSGTKMMNKSGVGTPPCGVPGTDCCARAPRSAPRLHFHGFKDFSDPRHKFQRFWIPSRGVKTCGGLPNSFKFSPCPTQRNDRYTPTAANHQTDSSTPGPKWEGPAFGRLAIE